MARQVHQKPTQDNNHTVTNLRRFLERQDTGAAFDILGIDGDLVAAFGHRAAYLVIRFCTRTRAYIFTDLRGSKCSRQREANVEFFARSFLPTLGSAFAIHADQVVPRIVVRRCDVTAANCAFCSSRSISTLCSHNIGCGCQ